MQSSQQNGFWHHCNFAPHPVQHSNKTAAYRITHLQSGRVYVGWLGDAYRGLVLIATRLQAGNFPNQTLQTLVTTAPECALEVFLVDSRLSVADTLDSLHDVMLGWIEAAGERYIPNSAALPPKKNAPGQPRVYRVVAGKSLKEPKVPAAKTARQPRVPKNPTGPWKNLHVGIKTHSIAGAFKLHHPKSNQYFVGSSKNLYDALVNLRMKLRSGELKFAEMQKAFADQPEFTLSLELTNLPELDLNQQLDAADKFVQAWKQEHQERCFVVAKGRTRGGVGRVSTLTTPFIPTEKVRYPKAGDMLQVQTKARDGAVIPPRDMIHQAWFGSGLQG